MGRWAVATARHFLCFTGLLIAGFGARTDSAYALAGNDGIVAFVTASGLHTATIGGNGADDQLLVPGARDGVWSPTGDRLAYVDANSVLWVVRADGSDRRRISDRNEEGIRPAWSPDGRLSYFNGARVVIVDSHGGHRRVIDIGRQLGHRVQVFDGPAWTSDGRLLVLLSSSSGVAPYIGRSNGSDFRPLSFGSGGVPGGLIDSFDWRVSSSGLVGYVEEPLGNGIYVQLDRLNGRRVTVPSGGSDIDLASRDLLAFAPSGDQVLLARGGELSVWSVDPDSLDITLDSGGFTVGGDVTSVDWQPRCTITGTAADDELTGTPGRDVICAGGGNDVIRGGGGNDVIFAGGGRDRMYGGAGNDVLVGGRGVDVIRGGRGNDLINSRDGRKDGRVRGGAGSDTCIRDVEDAVVSCG
jgi:Ca2+-binding RTX toxin-like protein